MSKNNPSRLFSAQLGNLQRNHNRLYTFTCQIFGKSSSEIPCMQNLPFSVFSTGIRDSIWSLGALLLVVKLIVEMMTPCAYK